MSAHAGSTGRSTIAAAAGLSAVALLWQRRRRRRATAASLRAAVLPPDEPDPVSPLERSLDEAHAPGHRHLDRPRSDRPRRPREVWPHRPDTKHQGAQR